MLLFSPLFTNGLAKTNQSIKEKLVKGNLYFILIVLVALTTATGCTDETPKTNQTAIAAQPTKTQPAEAGRTGTVVETMSTGNYTYVKVDTGSEKIWAAAPQFQVKVGDKVTFPEGVPMKNYHSKTLKRTFDLVYFVSNITVAGVNHISSQFSEGRHGGTQSHTSAPSSVKVDLSGIKKPEGGKTIAEIYAEKDVLSGKKVMVRGKVVKFSSQIMGKNWIHLQDGTGSQGTNDLTITTSSGVKVGDTVLATGVVVKDKDFGYGYVYSVIMEDAKIKIE